MQTDLVDLVEESFISSRCLSNNLEPISREFVVLGSSLSFGKLVDFSSDLDSRFEGEGESIVGLRLNGQSSERSETGRKREDDRNLRDDQ